MKKTVRMGEYKVVIILHDNNDFEITVFDALDGEIETIYISDTIEENNDE